MQKIKVLGGIAAAMAAVWLCLFLLARYNEDFRQSLPLPLLVILGNDDGFRGGEWDDIKAERNLSPDHIIEIFTADGIPGTASSEKENTKEQQEQTGEAEDEDEEDEDSNIYEKNPRYTFERDSKLGLILHTEVQTGDSLGRLLAQWMNPNEYTPALNAAKSHYNVAKIRAGQPVTVILDPKSELLQNFMYQIDRDQILHIKRTKKGFIASVDQIPYDVNLVRIHGAVRSLAGLESAITGMGEKRSLVSRFTKIFASEINFITDMHKGDSFEILVEKCSRKGEFLKYGKILAAQYINRGKKHQAYLFPNEKGKFMYFTEKGENLQRVLIKAPLSSLRITSKYSMARLHPISGLVRPHQGVDYGAPEGTPIKAIGDGVITQAARAGGFGNQVIIRHPGGLESMYGHMSRFAKGMKEGKAVRQGQTIGYVGATGTATGPHLDFRLKKRGEYVNPTKLVAPRYESVGGRKRMRQFNAIVAKVQTCWRGRNSLANYDPDIWF